MLNVRLLVLTEIGDVGLQIESSYVPLIAIGKNASPHCAIMGGVYWSDGPKFMPEAVVRSVRRTRAIR